MLGEGSVMDLFQFSTDVGYQAAIKVKPRNLLEMASANSLMRLMAGDGQEQPIDTFIKFKNDIQKWYDEMREHGLNDEEIKVMEEHLLKLNGVADTQESVMLLSMDKRVAGFDVKWANKLRKAIAKKSKKDMEEAHQEFFKRGKELGNRKEILKYVWDVQIKRQLGYSFSILHTLAYSVIALQELNLNYRFNPLYWNTACLTVNSGGIDIESDEDDEEEQDKKTRSTDYGKVASAISSVIKNGIKIALPDINKAGFGFIPDIENNQIIYGLKGINGIGDDIVQQIISNRPYTSFKDFIERMYNTGVIKKSQVVQLIKAGCFDSFGDRKEIMEAFIKLIYEPKEKLNMQSLGTLIEKNLVPEQYHLNARFYKFKKYISKFVYKTTTKPKDKLLALDEIATPFFNEHFSDDCVVDYMDGKLIISENKFKKEYDKKMEGIKSWVISKEALEAINNKLFEEEWQKHASGNLSAWEMASLSFYHGAHELEGVNTEKYGIVDFNLLPEEPEVIGYYKSRGQERPKYEIVRIAGTVLDKDKNKHTVTLLTTSGVVTVKFYDGAFAYYNKQVSRVKEDGSKEILEKSWFTRGNKLLLTGYRRGSHFKPHKYSDSIYSHTVALIKHVYDNGDLALVTERMG
jgi:DNA polymerase III subunit alpha